MPAELDVVDMRRGTRFKDQADFVLRAIEASHTAIGLGPDAAIDKCIKRFTAGLKCLVEMPPVHEYVMERTLGAGVRENGEGGQ